MTSFPRINHDSIPPVNEAAVALPRVPAWRAAVLKREGELVKQEWNRWAARARAVAQSTSFVGGVRGEGTQQAAATPR